MKLLGNAADSANRLSDEAGEGEVVVTTLDADIEEPVTLIKADIEGFEQRALAGARQHILNDHPKLLILGIPQQRGPVAHPSLYKGDIPRLQPVSAPPRLAHLPDGNNAYSCVKKAGPKGPALPFICSSCG